MRLRRPAWPAPLRRQLDQRLFRIRRDEALPAVLGHRRIFVLPTAFGIAFATTLVTMLVGSMNYALSLGYALTFLLCGVGIVSMHHAFRNLAGLRLRALRIDDAHAGQQARVIAVFDNRAARRRIALRLRCEAASAAPFSLAAGQAQCVELAVPAARRGWLRIDRFVLETRFPLGLVRAWSVLSPPARCLVYPALETPAPPLPVAHDSGTHDHGTRGGSEDFAGLREYREGDAQRHIAWRLAARNEAELHTKLFHGGSDARLVLDWSSIPAGVDTERRLSRLASWVLAAERAGMRYGLRLPDVRIETGRGAAHRERCLRALALHGFADEPCG